MTLYMKYCDARGNVSIQQHQVWDKDLFVASQQKAYAKEGGSAVVTDAADYRDHNWTRPL
jgi:hypothetical protein